jgi:hypothetical protein
MGRIGRCFPTTTFILKVFYYRKPLWQLVEDLSLRQLAEENLQTIPTPS